MVIYNAPRPLKGHEEWWDKLKLGRKVAIVTDARWVTNKGKLSKLGEKIAESKWGDLSLAAQNIIKRKEGMA